MSHDAAAVDPAVAHHAAERIDRPAVAGRHDVEVAVEVNDRTARPPRRDADDVHARMARGVLGAPFGGDVLDRRRRGAARSSPMKRAQASYSSPGGLTVGIRTRSAVNCDDLVGRAIDFGQNALDGMHG